MAKTLGGYIDLEIIVRKEDHQYSSWCPDLDIASCGDTQEEAVKNIADAVKLYLNTLEKEGEREDVFKERGIRIKPIDEPVIPRSFVTQYRQEVSLTV
ncbi:MAG: type II toxin-antitoxin system HicB family antitoxin [Chloroflexi bacterium]|nr:type II toxin-antitoxin system HicB family antitoxin [Chloroflexota bacterium]